MQEIIYQYASLITWIGIISSLTFFLSLLIIPWIVCALEKDFILLLHTFKQPKKKDEHPLTFILFRVLRYFLGTLLLLAGFLMIFLPGQGLLTIILGLSLLDFPGKHKAIDQLLQLTPVQKSLNWIREKGDKQPFVFKKNL